MGHASHRLSRDARMRAVWPATLSTAEQTPGLWADLGRRRDDLLPRVADYYMYLQALPRRVRRALQRRWRVSLATLALWLALGQLPALAATIPVGGGCTLVDALTAANTDTATGGCPAGSGADTIVLPPGSTQTLTSVHNNTFGPNGLPVVESVITIAGQGSTIVRAEGAPEFRLLAVRSTGDLTLQETTVRGGVIYGYNRSGGGVGNFGGTLLVTNSTITGNTAISCGGSPCYSRGGGVGNFGGTLLVTNSTITGNAATSGGGGIANEEGAATVTNSTISGNSGGGVLSGGTLSVTNSTISGNSGGGVRNFGTTLLVTNSTISGNTGGDGGMANLGSILSVTNSIISGNSAYYNGGVRNFGTTLLVTNSTISGNTAYGYSHSSGGGIENYAGTVTVTNSTISGNAASYGGGIDNKGFKSYYGITEPCIKI